MLKYHIFLGIMEKYFPRASKTAQGRKETLGHNFFHNPLKKGGISAHNVTFCHGIRSHSIGYVGWLFL